MKVELHTNHSAGNAELCAITFPNHEAYAARHGYEIVRTETQPGELSTRYLETLHERLSKCDYVLTHGADTLFMLQPKRVESLNQGESVTIAEEKLGFWPINNDVVLWRRSNEAIAILGHMILNADEWKDYKWGWQVWFWNKYITNADLHHAVRIAKAREMNATHQPGESRWQLGDFIIHFLDMDMPLRIQLAKAYAPLAGDGTYPEWAAKGLPAPQ